MSDDVYSLIKKKGPEALVGLTVEMAGVPHEIVSLAAIGGSMIVYNLRNLKTMAEDRVLKIPRARPGSPEHQNLTRSHQLAMERIPDLIPPTQPVRVNLSTSAQKSSNRKRPEVERLLQSFINYHLDLRLKSREFKRKVGV